MNKSEKGKLLLYKKKLMPKKILDKDPIRTKLIMMYASANDIGNY